VIAGKPLTQCRAGACGAVELLGVGGKQIDVEDAIERPEKIDI
jgi:hypothetical protein